MRVRFPKAEELARKVHTQAMLPPSVTSDASRIQHARDAGELSGVVLNMSFHIGEALEEAVNGPKKSEADADCLRRLIRRLGMEVVG